MLIRHVCAETTLFYIRPALFSHILTIIAPVFGVILLGYFYSLWRNQQAHHDMVGINRVSMDLFCPFLIFCALSSKQFDLVANASLVLAGALVALGSGLLAWPIARWAGYDSKTFLPPMMYNNCGNMGLPLATLAFGEVGLSAAVALFMACNLVYFSAGIYLIRRGHPEYRSNPWQLFANPMMLAMAAGTVCAIANWHLPPAVFNAFKMVGDACIPLMLFALGIRMSDINFASWRIGIAGAIVCPLSGLFSAWLIHLVLPLTSAQIAQLYLFASLPPAVFCFMVAQQYQQEPDKVAAIVLIGNAAATVFVPLGLWLGIR